MDTQNDAIFERRYILKTISFGIYCMLDFAGGSNWYLSGNEIGSIEVQVMNATCGEYHHTWDMIQTGPLLHLIAPFWGNIQMHQKSYKNIIWVSRSRTFSKYPVFQYIDPVNEIWSGSNSGHLFCSNPVQPNEIWSETSTFKLSFGEIKASTLLVKALSRKRNIFLFETTTRTRWDVCVCTDTYMHMYIYICTYLNSNFYAYIYIYIYIYLQSLPSSFHRTHIWTNPMGMDKSVADQIIANGFDDYKSKNISVNYASCCTGLKQVFWIKKMNCWQKMWTSI